MIDVGGKARRVDLNVAATGRDYFSRDHLALDGDNILEESTHAGIDVLRGLPFETLRDAIRADERQLHGSSSNRAAEPIFLEDWIAHERKTLPHRPAIENSGPVALTPVWIRPGCQLADVAPT